MADTSYGVNDPEAVKLWSRQLYREALRATRLSPFIGTSTDSIIQIRDDTAKGPGDRIRTTLRVQLTGDGVQGDSTQEGQEEALTTFTDDTVINQIRHAVRSGGRMSEQRIPFSVRDEAEVGLRDWWSALVDTSLFNQLAGNVVEADTKKTGNNSVTAHDATHLINVNGGNADDLSSANTFTLADIDTAVETATTLGETADGQTPLRPVMVGGEAYYVLFLHPFQVTSIRTSTTNGNWQDIQKSAIQGGDISNNPIFTGALGVYNNTILHNAARVPQAPNAAGTALVADTRAAIFCGAQAAILAFGRENGPSQMTWVEEMFDYGNKLGVSAGMIFGAKRAIYNSNTFGCFAIQTFAQAASNQ